MTPRERLEQLRAKKASMSQTPINDQESPRQRLERLRALKAQKEAVASNMEATQQPEQGMDVMGGIRKASDLVMSLSPMGQAKMLKEKVISPAFEKMGQKIAEKGGEMGVNPYVAGIAGGMVSEAPNIAEALAPAPVLAKEVTKLPVVKTLLAGPSREAGAAIGAIEKELGMAVDKVPSFPRTREGMDKFAESLKKISDLGPKGVTENLEPSGILEMKKQAELVLDHMDKNPRLTNKIARAFVSKGKEALDKAAMSLDPRLKEAMDAFKAAKSKEALISKVKEKGMSVAKGAGIAGATGAGIGGGMSLLKMLSQD